MSFLAPALLAGLLGLAIPVLAHLFGRKKPRVVRFAALHLIEQFPPARARQRTLQDLPLLVVRLLVLLVAVLAFAQPYTTEQRVIDVVAEAHEMGCGFYDVFYEGCGETVNCFYDALPCTPEDPFYDFYTSTFIAHPPVLQYAEGFTSGTVFGE
ncbi:MAG: BatA domain-containing protein, partial [Nannocystaceae bacterium]